MTDAARRAAELDEIPWGTPMLCMCAACCAIDPQRLITGPFPTLVEEDE